MGIFKNMSGNIPGGNFLGRNFLGRNFPGGSLMGGKFLGGSFPDTPVNIAKFLRTVFFIEHVGWLLLKNSSINQENIGGRGVIDLSF